MRVHIDVPGALTADQVALWSTFSLLLTSSLLQDLERRLTGRQSMPILRLRRVALMLTAEYEEARHTACRAAQAHNAGLVIDVEGG